MVFGSCQGIRLCHPESFAQLQKIYSAQLRFVRLEGFLHARNRVLEVVRIEVWCEKVEDQKLYMKGKLSNPVQLDIIDTPNYETAEVINSEATALFYQTLKKVMSFEQTYKLYGGRRGILLKDKILEQLIQDKEKLKHQTVETDETDHPKTAGFDSQMHLSKL